MIEMGDEWNANLSMIQQTDKPGLSQLQDSWDRPIRPKLIFKLKPDEISFVQNAYFSCQIALKICAEHGSYGSYTAVLYAKFQNDFPTEQCVMGKRDFTRFEFKMCLGLTSCIAAPPR